MSAANKTIYLCLIEVSNKNDMKMNSPMIAKISKFVEIEITDMRINISISCNCRGAAKLRSLQKIIFV